jgi:hypothetical protein
MVPTNHMRLPFVGELEGVFEKSSQFGKKRDGSRPFAVVAFCLGRRHGDSIAFPIDVSPFQREHFRRTTQSAEPRQTDDGSPGRIGFAQQLI